MAIHSVDKHSGTALAPGQAGFSLCQHVNAGAFTTAPIGGSGAYVVE